MRAVVQRVTRAAVTVAGEEVGRIDAGLCVLLAVAQDDGPAEAAWMVDRLCGLRIFPDAAGKMDRSVEDTAGSVLVVSQFTLYGDTSRGRRPSFTRSAKSADAQALYDRVLAGLSERLAGRVGAGRFGADMALELVNDGPVTLILDAPEPAAGKGGP